MYSVIFGPISKIFIYLHSEYPELRMCLNLHVLNVFFKYQQKPSFSPETRTRVTDFYSVISTVDDEYKRTEGFMNYYGIAHLYKEKVTEQPQIMRYGKLKPYQVIYIDFP